MMVMKKIITVVMIDHDNDEKDCHCGENFPPSGVRPIEARGVGKQVPTLIYSCICLLPVFLLYLVPTRSGVPTHLQVNLTSDYFAIFLYLPFTYILISVIFYLFPISPLT